MEVFAAIANALRRRLPAAIYLWTCDRLYHEAVVLYDPVAALISGGRWNRWGASVARRTRGRVLEVGPGPGYLLASLRRRGVEAYGVEMSPAMATRAARRTGGAIAQGDGRHLPVRDAAVDLILLTFPAPYALEPTFWMEAARVARRGARMRILLGAGDAREATGSCSIASPAPDWRVRRATVHARGATLYLLLARRQSPHSSGRGSVDGHLQRGLGEAGAAVTPRDSAGCSGGSGGRTGR